MENDLKKQIEERLSQLPPLVRDAVLSDDTGAKIRAIATKHQLHVDQSAALEDATMLVMLGFIPTEKFSDELQRQLLVEEAKAEQIITDIEGSIFLPIRDHMKGSSSAPTAAPTSAPAVAPAPMPTPATPRTAIQPAPAQIQISKQPELSMVAPTAAPASMPKPALPMAEEQLSQKTAVVAPAPNNTPQTNYKTDPYREPIE